MRSYVLIALGLAAVSSPASAHHSGAMFDRNVTRVMQGVVKEMQWTNPHAWLQVMVAAPGAAPVEWSFEMEGPNVMQRQGWKKNSVKPGDHVKITTHPLKDGRPGGSYMGITLADGSKLGREASPTPVAAAPPS